MFWPTSWPKFFFYCIETLGICHYKYQKYLGSIKLGHFVKKKVWLWCEHGHFSLHFASQGLTCPPPPRCINSLHTHLAANSLGVTMWIFFLVVFLLNGLPEYDDNVRIEQIFSPLLELLEANTIRRNKL